MEIIGNIRVGKREVDPWTAGHTRLVREGNRGTSPIRETGVKRVGPMFARATTRRSTGINPRGRTPIDPRMPLITPP
jgi:hypothetical protein